MRPSLEKFGSRTLIAVVAAALLLGLSAAASAQQITLADSNSQVQIDPTSQAGMNSWIVDGTNYDAKQWFWYRIGPTGGESSLDTLTMSAPVLTDTNGDGVIDTAFLQYTNDPTNHGLNVTVKMTVQGAGAGSGESDIAEQLKLQNKTSAPMDLHFYQYNNFILSNGQDVITFDGNNHVLQSGPVVSLGETIGINDGEGFVTGNPLHEAAAVPITLTSLNSGSPTTLSNNSGAGPGDLSWAFEWDVTLQPNGYLLISKDKILNVIPVPEPSSLLLLSLFGVCVSVMCWQRKRA